MVPNGSQLNKIEAGRELVVTRMIKFPADTHSELLRKIALQFFKNQNSCVHQLSL